MVRVLPAPNKPFQLFQEEDAYCRQYASTQLAGDADKANNDTLLDTGIGAVGGAVGAGLGAGGGAAVGGEQRRPHAVEHTEALRLRL